MRGSAASDSSVPSASCRILGRRLGLLRGLSRHLGFWRILGRHRCAGLLGSTLGFWRILGRHRCAGRSVHPRILANPRSSPRCWSARLHPRIPANPRGFLASLQSRPQTPQQDLAADYADVASSTSVVVQPAMGASISFHPSSPVLVEFWTEYLTPSGPTSSPLWGLYTAVGGPARSVDTRVGLLSVALHGYLNRVAAAGHSSEAASTRPVAAGRPVPGSSRCSPTAPGSPCPA